MAYFLALRSKRDQSVVEIRDVESYEAAVAGAEQQKRRAEVLIFSAPSVEALLDAYPELKTDVNAVRKAG